MKDILHLLQDVEAEMPEHAPHLMQVRTSYLGRALAQILYQTESR